MSGVHQTRVAVVDDDQSVCRALSRLLRAEGMLAVTYPSAAAFLTDAEKPAFDCLVFDIQLGGMSGIELHRQLNAWGLTPPVIYVTAHDEPGTRDEARAAGCVAYFSKTDPGEALLQAIRRAAKAEPRPPEP